MIEAHPNGCISHFFYIHPRTRTKTILQGKKKFFKEKNLTAENSFTTKEFDHKIATISDNANERRIFIIFFCLFAPIFSLFLFSSEFIANEANFLAVR